MGGYYDPCLDDYAKAFYNRLDVQKALHVSDGSNLRNWTICKYVCLCFYISSFFLVAQIILITFF